MYCLFIQAFVADVDLKAKKVLVSYEGGKDKAWVSPESCRQLGQTEVSPIFKPKAGDMVEVPTMPATPCNKF